MRKMIIDTDTASDDAVAIMMALNSPNIDVVALTVVGGNVGLKQASINARYTVELCGHETPVYEGTAVPLLREFYSGQFFHGLDGMGNMNYPAPQRPAEKKHGVQALIEHIEANPGIILVTLGPMTNVAMAVTQAPHIIKNVSRCVVMGGAYHLGNITPAAEYNIWCDPEAARICFRSGLPIEMVGIEICRGEANLHEKEVRLYKEEIDTPLSNFIIDCNATGLKVNKEWLSEIGIGLPDPIAMAIAIDPKLCTRSSKHHVEIECDGTFTRGMTVVDELNVTAYDTANVAMWRPVTADGSPHISVCWELDIPGWKALLEQCVRAHV